MIATISLSGYFSVQLRTRIRAVRHRCLFPTSKWSILKSRYLFQIVERQQKFTINCARSNCHHRATTDFNSPRLLAREKQ
jgi:hypothetical protein